MNALVPIVLHQAAFQIRKPPGYREHSHMPGPAALSVQLAQPFWCGQHVRWQYRKVVPLDTQFGRAKLDRRLGFAYQISVLYMFVANILISNKRLGICANRHPAT